MLKRVLSTGLAVLSLTGSAVFAQDGGEAADRHRMTLVRIDAARGRVMCAEHQRWIAVAKADLARVRVGDIVRLEPAKGQPARVVLLRTGADEISSPEQ
jgi:hypothetical protein